MGGLGGAFTSSLLGTVATFFSSDALPAGVGLSLSPASGSKGENTSHAIYFCIHPSVDLLVSCVLLKSSRGSSSPWVL